MVDTIFEHWRTIPSWPEYQASSEGRIRRIDGWKIVPQTLESPRHSVRYMRVSLTLPVGDPRRTRTKRNRTASVHVLVCEAFNGPRPAQHEAHHTNEQHTDNRAGNLQWMFTETHWRTHGRLAA